MGEEEMVVAVVAIAAGTGVWVTLLNTIKAIFQKRGRDDQATFTQEIKALREEVQHLRRQNNDLILGLDNQMRLVDRRLDHLESRSLGAHQSHEETQVVGSRRS